MIRINVVGGAQVQQKLQGLAKQLAFGASLGVNRVAQQYIRDVQDVMPKVFSNPTPFTLRSMRQRELATAQKPEAVVDFKALGGTGAGLGLTRTADKYLRYQVSGGERRLKAFERALVSIRAMPNGMFAVPGPGAQFDRYGNVRPGQIVAILSYFRAFQEDGMGWKMNSTDATRRKMARGTRTRLGYRYFVGSPGGRAGSMGIYQDVRIGSGVRELLPVFFFVRSAYYRRKRLDLDGLLAQTWRRHGERLMQAAVRQALATAK